MAVFECDNREHVASGYIALVSSVRGLAIAGVIVGPVVLGSLVGWAVTFTLGQDLQRGAGQSAARILITEDEVRAAGLSPRAAAGILRVSN